MSLRNRHVVRCPPCGRWVRRAPTVDGKTVVLDPEPDAAGRWVVEFQKWRQLDPDETSNDAQTFREHRETCGARRS